MIDPQETEQDVSNESELTPLSEEALDSVEGGVMNNPLYERPSPP